MYINKYLSIINKRGNDMHKFRQLNQILNEAMQISQNKIIEIDKTYQSNVKREEKLKGSIII